eukprot:scaffold22327_cov48-Phaeocystis_antarctica.AAC.1
MGGFGGAQWAGLSPGSAELQRAARVRRALALGQRRQRARAYQGGRAERGGQHLPPRGRHRHTERTHAAAEQEDRRYERAHAAVPTQCVGPKQKRTNLADGVSPRNAHLRSRQRDVRDVIYAVLVIYHQHTTLNTHTLL